MCTPLITLFPFYSKVRVIVISHTKSKGLLINMQSKTEKYHNKNQGYCFFAARHNLIKTVECYIRMIMTKYVN